MTRRRRVDTNKNIQNRSVTSKMLLKTCFHCNNITASARKHGEYYTSLRVSDHFLHTIVIFFYTDSILVRNKTSKPKAIGRILIIF